MNQPAPQCSTTDDPLAQAREIRVTLRSDLHVSRQMHQGEAVYVVHDPISFRTHRLSVFQYRVLAALNPGKTLGENFQTELAKGEFYENEESLFFDLVSSFSRLGLIVMPGANGARLYEQHLKMKSMKRRSKVLGALFMQIPLVNPDKFLSRWIGRMSWLFTREFFCIWLMGMAAAGFVIWNRRSDLIEPLNGILATKNLPFLWLAFVGLKIWHELGHGFACKKFGGYVPEMGTILIAGTPAAFVDATSAWSFPERRKRLIVMCGGMFFESLVFIPGVFVWAFSNSPMLASCAYQLVVMASLVTILFNANPLMKFDGYFILSELIGIQNLRPRADAQIKRILASTIVGVKKTPSEDSVKTKVLQVIYGISAMIYKTTLVISIAVMVAFKFPLVGLGLAAFHVITSVGMGAIKMTSYLLKGKETAPVRGRARLVAAVVMIGLPIASCFVPIPFGVVTQGLVGAQTEHYINVDSPGELEGTLVTSGEQVSSDTPLVQLKNQRLQEELTISQASLQEAILRWQVVQEFDLAEAERQKATIEELTKQTKEMTRRAQLLTVPSPGEGKVVQLIQATDRGRFLTEGTPLAIVVDGKTILRTWVNEDKLGSIMRESGTEVTFRVPGRSTETYTGHIMAVEPAPEDVFDKMALTYIAGGEILVDPATGKPMEPVFQIDIEPTQDILKLTEHGSRINVRLPRRYESIAAWTFRKCMRFVQKVLVT